MPTCMMRPQVTGSIADDTQKQSGALVLPQPHIQDVKAASGTEGRECAADHLKTSLTTAIATSLLAWGLLEFPQARPCPAAP